MSKKARIDAPFIFAHFFLNFAHAKHRPFSVLIPGGSIFLLILLILP
jgi:hypothetical protein